MTERKIQYFLSDKLMEIKGKKTRSELSKNVGVSVSSINYYITGERTPTLHTLIKLCDELGLEVIVREKE